MSAWSHLSPADALRRARTLDALAGADGVICGAAADHRDALRAVLERRGLELGDDDVGALKARVTAALAPAATLILLDVELGAPAAIAAGALPGTTALVVPLEEGGYGDVARLAETTLLPGWSPHAARAAGAAACKLLLPYRSDLAEQAARQEAVVARCAAACREAGTVLVLEPIVYRREGEELDADRFAALVVDGARRLAAHDPGLLKLQYPGTPEACQVLDSACGPGTPWVLLGGGAGEQELVAQLRDACAAGASGFIVGRTLWADALVPDPDGQEAALAEHARPRLERLAAIAREAATPWRDRVGPIAAPGRDPYGATVG